MYTILQQDMLSNFYVILKHNLHIIMNKQSFTQCGYASTACAYCNSRIRSFFSTSCYPTVCSKIHNPVIYSNYILVCESRRSGLIILLLLMIQSTRQKTRHMAENVCKYTFSISHKSHYDFIFRKMSPIWHWANNNKARLIFWRAGHFSKQPLAPCKFFFLSRTHSS